MPANSIYVSNKIEITKLEGTWHYQSVQNMLNEMNIEEASHWLGCCQCEQEDNRRAIGDFKKRYEP